MAATKSAPSPLAAKADELGALEKEYAILIAPFKLKQPRLNALREEFREACPTKPDEPWTVAGAHFEVTLGPRAQWRSVNMAALVKLAGIKVVTKIASVTLKALEAACSPEIVAAVVTKDHTGPRTLTTIEKGA